jgi:hypothetical protein
MHMPSINRIIVMTQRAGAIRGILLRIPPIWERTAGVTNMNSKMKPDLALIYTAAIDIQVVARYAEHQVLVLVLP